MNMTNILAQVAAGLSTLFLFLSTRTGTTHRLYLFQAVDATFSAIGYLLLGGWTGAAMNLIAAGRNLLSSRGSLTRSVTIAVAGIQVIAGLAVNRSGLNGLLPIVASTSYTLTSLMAQDKITWARWSLMLNLGLWLVYNLLVGAWVGALSMAFLMCSTAWTMCRDSQSRDLTKHADSVRMGEK